MVMRACGSGLTWPDFRSGDEEGVYWATTGRTSASDAAREADNRSIRVKVIICLNTILYRARAEVKRCPDGNLDAGSTGTAALRKTPHAVFGLAMAWRLPW